MDGIVIAHGVAVSVPRSRMLPQSDAEHPCAHVCLPCRFRELGCSCAAVRIQVPSEAGGEPVTSASYNVTLLVSGDKTLAQSFPKPKLMKKAGPR